MAILALIKLDYIKIDWKKKSIFLVKIISICNKVIYDIEKSSSFINIWLQILQIKFLEIKKFANFSKWRIVSQLIKSLEHKGN